MTNQQPLVTICMAAFNAAEHISCAIESILDQTYYNWELICVNDGSTDDTLSILEEYTVKDERIEVITQTNTGPALARRQAYLRGSGEYFIALDSDDRFGVDALQTLITDAISSDADIIMADMRTYDSQRNEWHSFSTERGMYYGQCITGEEAFDLTFPWTVNGNCFMLKRKIVESSMGVENFFNNYNSDEYLTRVFCLKATNLYFSRAEYIGIGSHNSLMSNKFNPRRLHIIQTNRRLLQLAVDAKRPVGVISRVLTQTREQITRFGGGMLGYQFGKGNISFPCILFMAHEIYATIDLCIVVEKNLSTLELKSQISSSNKFGLLWGTAYWFIRELLVVKLPILRSIVRVFRT